MTNPQLDIEQTDMEEQQTATESQSLSSCPECDGPVVHDEEHGETTCGECGLVLDDTSIDRGPEWRAFYHDEQEEKSRVGAPTTHLMHDKGLSTTISWQNKDAYGKSVSPRKREQLQRMRTWDERFRTKDSHERNLKQALGEISRMASALGVSSPVRETAGAIYHRAVDENLLPGRSIEGMSTASLYAAARQHGTPRSLSEFATVSRVKEIRIQRAYRYMSRELNLQIEPADPLEYVPQFASALEISDEATRQARDLLKTAKAEGVHSGKSPDGLAAAAIYAATHLTNEQLTQETVGNAAHVSKVTVRTRYKELLEVYAADSGDV
ncbi:transcription initiation factor IIB [Haloarcula amylovorans]|uniref:transcription initiation factor IIB n=1 Tax=Haloarcula amylovorans TaxID=2562280 RepID=UPI0010767CBD|nr:TFIIB-type zinc ribbon-containing protein [Halomicroarcula amylolytica]